MKIRGSFLLLVAPIAIAPAAAWAEPGETAESGWYFHGGFEAGGRVFIDRPPSGFGKDGAGNWLTPRTGQSSAKFEQYGQISTWFVDSIYFDIGSRDGLYAAKFWADNVGYNNQAYELDLSKAGEHYLSLRWDQTPSVISRSGKTVFQGAGTSNLTVVGPRPTGTFVNDNATRVTLGTQRDKASASYKYTPDSQWTFKVDYSHEERSGGIATAFNLATTGGGGSVVEAILPIDERTQNINATAQYVGMTPWNTKWITSLQYAGSFYDNHLTALNAENPLVAAGAQANLRMALAPSNTAHAFTFNNVVDLPGRSRLANTVQYNMMRQNDSFVSTIANGQVGLAPFPASSLNGKVDTLLINNVLTTQLTDNLKSTLRYRYYDYDNDTPELLWENYIRNDSNTLVSIDRTNLAMGYRKQNASADLNWKALPWLRLGATYGWEQYDRTRRDANVTNEHSGRIYADADLWGAATARGSVSYSERRYDRYDLAALVRTPAGGASGTVAEMRRFDMANRDRLKIDGALDFDLGPFTVSPSAGLRNDNYPTDIINQLGVSKDHGWNAGVDISTRVSPTLFVTLGYHFDDRTRRMSSGGSAVNRWSGKVDQRYHTFMASADWQAIPDRLKFRFDYIYAASSGATPCQAAFGSVSCPAAGADYPNTRDKFQRFNAIASYSFDPAVVRQMGFAGDVTLNLRYTYEENKGDNWAYNDMQPVMGNSLYLAWLNPNYRAQLVAVSLAAKW